MSDLSLAADLSAALAARTARVAVMGLGYAGLPLAEVFVRAGFPVLAFDIDAAKIDHLRAGKSYLGHIPDARIQELLASGRFQPTDDPARLTEADVYLLCVPTPLNEHREPNLSAVVAAALMVARHIRPGRLVVLESTTYPGTTRDVVRPMLEVNGLVCGQDFFLAYSPEREDPGRSEFTTAQIPRVVGGVDEAGGRLACELFAAAVERVVPVSSAEVAEASKLLENTYRAVNIALVNELKVLYQRMGIDIWEVIAAAKTKPFGFQAFYPGPGIGGHCIPIDPFYLTWIARSTAHRRASLNWPARSTPPCRSSSSRAWRSRWPGAAKRSREVAFSCWAWRTSATWTTRANRRDWSWRPCCPRRRPRSATTIRTFRG